MTVLHDDGLYRHLAFRNKEHGWNLWFDLITVPGALIFQGDGDSFVFHRDKDMFAFFRLSAWKGQPNPSYWAEKLTSGRNAVMEYDRERMEEQIREVVTEADFDAELHAQLTKAVEDDVMSELCGDESLDRAAVDQFRFYANEKDRHAWPPKDP